jgi:hypothetical protein
VTALAEQLRARAGVESLSEHLGDERIKVERLCAFGVTLTLNHDHDFTSVHARMRRERGERPSAELFITFRELSPDDRAARSTEMSGRVI